MRATTAWLGLLTIIVSVVACSGDPAVSASSTTNAFSGTLPGGGTTSTTTAAYHDVHITRCYDSTHVFDETDSGPYTAFHVPTIDISIHNPSSTAKLYDVGLYEQATAGASPVDVKVVVGAHQTVRRTLYGRRFQAEPPETCELYQVRIEAPTAPVGPTLPS